MAMTVTYGNLAGQVTYEDRAGTESYYGPDTLGSIAALQNTSGAVTDTYDYWSYGEVRNHTGTSTTALVYVGTLGYYQDVASQLTYVRARYLKPRVATWQTLDPIWPSQKAYAYVYGSPTFVADPSGLAGIQGTNGPLCGVFNEIVYNVCSSCYKFGPPSPECQARCDTLSNQYYNSCKGPRPPTKGWHPGGPPGIVPWPVPAPPPPSPPLYTLCPLPKNPDCLGAGAGSDPYGRPIWSTLERSEHFVVGDCLDCCKNELQDNDALERCKGGCRWAVFLLITLGLNNFYDDGGYIPRPGSLSGRGYSPISGMR